MATLGGVDLGTVYDERETKEANLDVMPMPMSDSSDVIVDDWQGCTLNITITGILTADTLENLRTKINNLKALINGNQSAIVYSNSDGIYNTINVFVKSIDGYRSLKQTGLSGYEYTIKLVEGT